MPLSETLLIVAEHYSALTGRSLATTSTLAANDGKLLRRLGEGAGITIRRYEAIMMWFSEHWPRDAEWPSEVQRPILRPAA